MQWTHTHASIKQGTSEWVSLPRQAVFGDLVPSRVTSPATSPRSAQLRVEPEDMHSCSQLPSQTLSVLTYQQRFCSDTKTKDDEGCICKKSNPVNHLPTPIYFSLNKVINTFPCYISIINHYINGSLSCNYYCVSKNLWPWRLSAHLPNLTSASKKTTYYDLNFKHHDFVYYAV